MDTATYSFPKSPSNNQRPTNRSIDMSERQVADTATLQFPYDASESAHELDAWMQSLGNQVQTTDMSLSEQALGIEPTQPGDLAANPVALAEARRVVEQGADAPDPVEAEANFTKRLEELRQFEIIGQRLEWLRGRATGGGQL